mmetsp:Transcript_9374/g.23303  ORF Transcript_9374/g.23303 Transcript_9374/m.23303 type:complete len:281 (-) Transcript_9374:353-1195(-)
MTKISKFNPPKKNSVICSLLSAIFWTIYFIERIWERERERERELSVALVCNLYSDLEEGVLRPDPWVVQAGADAVGLDDLTVVVLEELAEGAVQDARLAVGERGRVLVRIQAVAGRLHSDEPHVVVLHEIVEEAHGVAATADARHENVGLGAELFQALLPRLLADAGVEISHHHRVRVGAGHGSKDVVCSLHIGHPISDGFAGSVLEGGRAGRDRAHLRAQKTHPEHVQRLALHVLRTHVDNALEPKPCADSGSGHAVLARAGFRDDALLAELLAHKRLA